MNILVLNAGSSTLKYQIIATDLDRIRDDKDKRIAHGTVDHPSDMHAAIGQVLDRHDIEIDAAGHRIVHGGSLFSESALITDEVLEGIRACSELAPLHNPSNIDGILACRERFGNQLPQVAVFDTAFHHTIPEHAYLYAIPFDLYRKHKIRRYGFHGTSHRYVAHRYRKLTGRTREQTNIITLHLGNGCSAAAIKHGASVDTSMGLTPLEGLVMGTRSGDIDPGALSFIAGKEHLSLDQVEELLNKRSGLLGLSGSSDMRELDADSRAVKVFCYRAAKYVGAYLAGMSGADAIVFTGGIGEHSAKVRSLICDYLRWFGLELDPNANTQANASEMRITTEASRVHAYCIPTDEELLIARDTVRVIAGVPHHS